MKVHVLKSKLKKVYVTDASEHYEGSITIDAKLMEAAGIQEWEKVDVNGKKRRITTYVLKGEYGSGCIEMNGNAARCFKKGEAVHILSYCLMSPLRSWLHNPVIVETDEKNNINSIDRIF